MNTWFTSETLQTTWFSVLASFVAINTMIYATISFISVLPRIYPTQWFSGRNTRSETRSIYPEI
ncbi:unannotated protein [freshwater metagenome]|uniref:Unannotated protein n=1 Tax=freshwater metagenome TaxID=449393 RepID=A0A6J5YVK6_9ZZZZ